MVRVGRDIKNYLVTIPLSRAGTPSTRPILGRSSLNPKILSSLYSKTWIKTQKLNSKSAVRSGSVNLILCQTYFKRPCGNLPFSRVGMQIWSKSGFDGSNAEGWKNGQNSNHKMFFLDIFTYTWPHTQGLNTYVWLQPYSSIQTLCIFDYFVVLQLSINWTCHTAWVPNPNKFVSCWTGNHSNYCVTKCWGSCRSLGQIDFNLALSKHPGIPFFSRSTHKKLVWRSQGCIFEAPERICTHTRMWFMPELLIQSRNGNAATACGSFTQMLPKYHKGNLE